MKTAEKKSLLLLGALAVAGCSGPEPHEHHHGPQDREAWVRGLDDPARDAWQRPAEVVAAMELAEGMVVADVGAGTGYFEPHLSRAVGPGGRVLALDIDPDLVARMTKRFAEAGLTNVEARLVTPASPGLAPGSVDRVLVVDTWHHMTGRAEYARELRQLLRPGGRVHVVDHAPDAPVGPPPELRLRPEQVMAELDAAGLTSRTIVEGLPRHFVVVGELPE